MKKDKEKIVDEIWDTNRIAEFLNKEPMGSEGKDYSQLLNAYRSMRSEDFEKFVDLFVENGGKVNAKNAEGQTLSEVVQKHENSLTYLAVLENHIS